MAKQGRIIGGGMDLNRVTGRAPQPSPRDPFAGIAAKVAAKSTANAAHVAAATGAGGAAGAVGAQTVDVPAVVFEVSEANLDAAAQLSTVVPVVLLITSPQSEESAPQQQLLSDLTRKLGGKVGLGIVDADNSRQIIAALGVTALPTALLLLAGRPEMLYQGAQTAQTLEQLLSQIVALAAQQGVSGQLRAPDLDPAYTERETETEPQQNPAHQAAYAAAEEGDFAGAIAEYERVLRENPADDEARAALAQMRLLQRLKGQDATALRQAAAANPDGVVEQLAVADLDISGGHVEDAFLRLLELFERSESEARSQIQARLLELFVVVGAADPRVGAARRRLATLIY